MSKEFDINELKATIGKPLQGKKSQISIMEMILGKFLTLELMEECM